MQTNYKKAYKARKHSPADQILEFLKARGEATQTTIVSSIYWRGADFHVASLWRAISYLFNRGVITREQKLNSYTKRIAFHYTIAQN